MSFINDMVQKFNRFFSTDINLENCVDDFERIDSIIEIKLNEINSAYNLLISSYRIDEYKVNEEEVEKANTVDLMIVFKTVDFPKKIANLIKFSRTCALYYSLNDKITEGDIEYICEKLDLVDKILKYETIKFFNQKRDVKLIWSNNVFVYPSNINNENNKDFHLIREIITQNLQILSAIQSERYLNGALVCCNFKVGNILQTSKYNNFNI